MQKDLVAVIGAGLSGLSAAVRLSNNGIPAVVIEAGEAIGGCCSTELVDGFRFNNGAVYGAVPSLLKHAFSRLDIDPDSHLRLRPIAVPQLSILESGTRVFTTDLGHSRIEGENADMRSAIYRIELARLYEAWRPVYRRLIREVLPHELSLARVLARLWRYLPQMAGSVAGVLEKSFSDPEARAAIGAVTLYTGLAPRNTPAAQIVGLLALLDEGFFLPEGGMGSIAEAIGKKALGNGVQIRLNSKAAGIEFGNGRLRGVRLESGELVAARTVIATNSARDVIANLLEPGMVAPALRRRAKRAPLSHRAISIQLGIQPAAGFAPAAFAVNHVPLLEEQHRFHLPASDRARWFAYTNPTSVMPELAPDGAAIVEMFAPAPPRGRAEQIRPDEVDAIADRYIAGLQARYPFRIVAKRIVGPADFMRRRHLHEGALYGLAPWAKPGDFFPRRMGGTDLYLAGQSTYPGYGVPPAILTGVHAADAVMRQRG